MNSAIDLLLNHAVSEAQAVADGAEDFTADLYCQLPRNYVRRMPSTSSNRFYFAWQGEELKYGCGLSGFAKHMSNSYYLNEWIKTNGKESDELLRIAAAYGTFVHVMYSIISTEYAQGRGFKVNRSLNVALKEYMDEMGIPKNLVGNWMNRLTNDATSFFRWLIDWNVEIVACEYPVFDWELGVSTPIDLVFAYEKKGKRIVAAMNYKTRGSSQVYESDEYQIPVEAMLLDRNLPNLGVAESFVWIPRKPKRETTDPWITKDMLKVKHNRLGRPYSWEDFVRDWNWQKNYGPNTYSYSIDLDKPIEDMGLIDFDPKAEDKLTFEGAKTIRQYCAMFKPEKEEPFVI